MTTSHSSRRGAHVALVAAAVALIGALGVSPGAAGHSPAHINGTVGEIVDPDAALGGFYLRYVGDPAPAGYSHNYQWDNPFTVTQPEAGPVSFTGTLDLTQRVSNNSVAMIGLLDRSALEGGATEFQAGAYIYVNNRTNGDVRIGVTDGNAGGGELVQTTVTVPAATANAGPLSVTFTVDGTADPALCAKPSGSSGGAEGCMTLAISGFPTQSDSYGAITGASDGSEFASGAIPGWESFPSGSHGVSYDLTISPATVDPQNKEQCMDDGWADYGFRNQGQCIRFVETGQDDRQGG